MATMLPMAGVKEDVWIPTACDMCYNGCTVRVHRVDGVAVKVEGIPEAAPNYGTTCAKGLAALMNVYSPNRVQAPMVRTNPEKGMGVDPGWQEISWDEAMDLLVEQAQRPRWTRIRGASSPTPSTATRSTSLRAFSYGRRQPERDGRARPASSAATARTRRLHADRLERDPPRPPLLQPPADVRRRVRLRRRAQRHGLQRRDGRTPAQRGMKLTVVDPVLTYAASHADEWIPIRPGTDAALALAIMREWVIVLDQLRQDLPAAPHQRHVPDRPRRPLRPRQGHGKPLVGIAATGAVGRFDQVPPTRPPSRAASLVDGQAVCPSFVAVQGAPRSRTRPSMPRRSPPIPAATITARRPRDGGGRQHRPDHPDRRRHLPAPAGGRQPGTAASPPIATRCCAGMAMGQLNMLLGAVDVPGGILNSSCSGPTWMPNLDPDGLIYPGNPLGRPHEARRSPGARCQAPETLELQELFPVSVYARAMLWLGLLDGRGVRPPLQVRGPDPVPRQRHETSGDPETMAEALRTDRLHRARSTPSPTRPRSSPTCSCRTPTPSSGSSRSSATPTTSRTRRCPSRSTGTWNFQQPIVKAVPQARNWGEVLFDVAERGWASSPT